MKLIVGLGNPGARYEGTRHNVGFDVVQRLAAQWMPAEPVRHRFHGHLLDGTVDGTRCMLLRPDTFMNRSGVAVSEAIAFYKIDPESALLIIVDDLALACGAIRLRAEGSPGGHNGLIDISRRLGHDRYARLRIGIDAPGETPQADYVLGTFRPQQRESVDRALTEATEAAACWAARGCTEAMNRFNRRQTA